MAQDTKYGQVEIPGIPDDEPVFILRAQDKIAPQVVGFYSELARSKFRFANMQADEAPETDRRGLTPTQAAFVESVENRVDEIWDWQDQDENMNRVKLPD